MRKKEIKLHISNEADDILNEVAQQTTYTRSIVVDMLLKRHGREMLNPENHPNAGKYAFNG